MCLRLPDERIVATENFFCGSESENEIFIYGGNIVYKLVVRKSLPVWQRGHLQPVV